MLRSTLLAAFYLAVPALGQVVSYEATLLYPEEEGWVRDPGDFLADRFLEEGWFVNVAEIVRGVEEHDSYRRFIPEFSKTTDFWVEWRMSTNGPSEAIPAVAPAAVAVSGTIGIAYHFTIADDQVRLIQDVTFPFVWADIEPKTPHTHRLELCGTEEFKWFIDGALIYAGVPEGAYPTPDSRIVFGCFASMVDQETVCSFDYVRFGVLPAPGSGDLTNDGEINGDDLYYFQECLTSPSGSWAGCAWADMDNDGDTDCDDWTLFVAAWTDRGDPPIVVECMCSMADMNDTNTVDAADLALLLGAWGPNPSHPADLSNSSIVNASDLALLLGNWGPCP